MPRGDVTLPDPTDLSIAPEVAAALAAGQAVVALETTVIAQGLPWPHNRDSTRRMDEVIRATGAVPAAIGIVEGQIVVGLSPEQQEAFARHGSTYRKVSRRDLAAVVVQKANGATTVSATLIIAALAGISVFATGGIGGVHPGAETSFDISADLVELGRQPVLVVASGAKSILDLPKTLEVLETNGVPVVGYRTNDFPAFYSQTSGLALEDVVGTPAAAAAYLSAQQALGLGGVLIANPVPENAALPQSELARWTDQAEAEATKAGVSGAALTPFLLRRLFELSEGRTLTANLALLEANAALAAEIAVAYAKQSSSVKGRD